MPLSREEKEKLRTELTLDETIKAPVYKGVEVGKIEFFVDGKLIGRPKQCRRKVMGIISGLNWQD